MDAFVVREYGPETCATLSMHGPFDQMPGAFGTIYGWLQSHRHVPHGMPVAVYLNDPATVAPADALWELRAPVEEGAQEYGPDEAGLAIKRIPAMTVATTVHQGPYDEVAEAYGRLRRGSPNRAWRSWDRPWRRISTILVRPGPRST